MIDEKKLYDMLELLQIYVGNDDAISDRLYGAIDDVLDDLEIKNTQDFAQENVAPGRRMDLVERRQTAGTGWHTCRGAIQGRCRR